MGDEIRVPVSLPLDSDGFLRRECPTCEEEFNPTCEEEFKWFSHAEGDHDAEQASQYFCPICGAAAGLDSSRRRIHLSSSKTWSLWSRPAIPMSR